jgi:hypothetical protein
MQYTVQAVSQEVREYDSKYGPMKSYKLKFKETETVAELSQKASTPAPTEGQVLNGTIDMSGQFGPKFKKEFAQQGFGQSPQQSSTQNGGQTGSSAGGKFNSDPFTMYLSYAKDVAVGLIGSKAGYTDEQFSKILEDVLAGGKVLYDGRPGAEPAEKLEDDKPKDNLPDDTFDGSEPVDVGEIPF